MSETLYPLCYGLCGADSVPGTCLEGSLILTSGSEKLFRTLSG